MASIIGVETLQHTNGTTAATIDSSGRILKPQQIAFVVNKSSGGNTTYAANSVISADMTNAEINVGGHFKTSGADAGKFVAPVAGYYQFNMSMFNNTSTVKRVHFVRSSDNSAFAGMGQSGQYTDFRLSGITHLDAGEKVYVTNSYADTVIFHANGHSYFSGFLIG